MAVKVVRMVENAVFSVGWFSIHPIHHFWEMPAEQTYLYSFRHKDNRLHIQVKQLTFYDVIDLNIVQFIHKDQKEPFLDIIQGKFPETEGHNDLKGTEMFKNT